MPTLTIRHVTTYRYRRPVAFGEHRMMLRPRDPHDQRVIGGPPNFESERIEGGRRRPRPKAQVRKLSADAGAVVCDSIDRAVEVI